MPTITSNYTQLLSINLKFSVPVLINQSFEEFVSDLVDNLDNNYWQNVVRTVDVVELANFINNDTKDQDFLLMLVDYIAEVSSEIKFMLEDEWFAKGHTVYFGSDEIEDPDTMSTAYNELCDIADYLWGLSDELEKLYQNK